jgi:hypothetical protein
LRVRKKIEPDPELDPQIREFPEEILDTLSPRLVVVDTRNPKPETLNLKI